MDDRTRKPNAKAIQGFMIRKGMARNGNPDAKKLFKDLPYLPGGGGSLRKIQMIVSGQGRHAVEVFHAIAHVLEQRATGSLIRPRARYTPSSSWSQLTAGGHRGDANETRHFDLTASPGVAIKPPVQERNS